MQSGDEVLDRKWGLATKFVAIETLRVGMREKTLTDGYAHALSLEGERLRLERRLSELARELDTGDTEMKTDELSLVAKRLDGNAGDLSRLRAALAELRRHAAAVR